MARDGSGNFTRVGGAAAWVDDRNANIKIRADLHDTHDEDIATAITNSLAKNGETPTTARIPFAFGWESMDGTFGAPAWRFTSDPNTGIYRIGADNIGVACNGAKVLDIGTAGLAVTGTFSSTGALSGVTSGTITRSGANSTFILERTDTHGDGVVVGEFSYLGRDSGAASQQYAMVRVRATLDNAAAEEGEYEIHVTTGGAATEVISATGAGITIGVNAGNKAILRGTATNDSAAAGFIGEYIESVIAVGSAVSLTTATQTNITSISLTAGDWDVDGEVTTITASTTNVTRRETSTSTTSASLDMAPTRGASFAPHSSGLVGGAGEQTTVKSGPSRFSLTATTTIFLVARAAFTVSTLTAFGAIRARRVR